jgi:demethylmenaquinone methyltransferase/2-methoxy-6-polyprenyl-1,4-benzoquinol methylase
MFYFGFWIADFGLAENEQRGLTRHEIQNPKSAIQPLHRFRFIARSRTFCPPMGRAIAPHPELPRYYAGDAGKRSFVRRIFNQTAPDYDRVERFMALGSGSWYRRQALKRAGLAKGMRVLDVAIGTGLVAREEALITGDPKLVLGLDPSIGMLTEARRSLTVPAVLGIAEELPLAADSFDFLSMGYALRHLSDLSVTFREFFRVLKPGGRICVLEISRPRTKIRRAAIKGYMRFVVPVITRLATGHANSQLLWQYYWDTIEACVPAETVLAALTAAGFEEVAHTSEIGIFSEYSARRPARYTAAG